LSQDQAEIAAAASIFLPVGLPLGPSDILVATMPQAGSDSDRGAAGVRQLC